MPEALFAPAFALWGSPVTWLELAAVVLSLVMVWCNIREIHWAWPLAIVASLMYWAIFWRNRLYGEASLQVFFVVVAAWGWWQWLRGSRADGSALHVARLSARGRWAVVALTLLAWPLTALFLDHYTDSDVPWWDAFPTALSVIAQFLLGRKYIENWAGWALVNVVSVGVFIIKGLWLTMGLYLVFAVLSVAGWRAWQRQLARP